MRNYLMEPEFVLHSLFLLNLTTRTVLAATLPPPVVHLEEFSRQVTVTAVIPGEHHLHGKHHHEETDLPAEMKRVTPREVGYYASKECVGAGIGKSNPPVAVSMAEQNLQVNIPLLSPFRHLSQIALTFPVRQSVATENLLPAKMANAKTVPVVLATHHCARMHLN